MKGCYSPNDDSRQEVSDKVYNIALSRRSLLTTTSVGLLGVSVSASGTAAAANSIYTPRLHTEGNWIKDPRGNNVVLRGVNTDGPLFAAYYDDTFVPEKIRMATNGDWYARTIRLPCERDRINNEANGDVQSYAQNYIDPAVDEAASQGVYILIDYHAVADWDDPGVHSDLEAFWDVVAPRYAAREHVLYELFNEPAHPSTDTLSNWKDWRATAQPWVDSIRADAPETPIIIGGPRWCQLVKYADDAPFSGRNLIYAAHIYPAHYEYLNMDAIAETARNVPMAFTEWGYTNNPDAPDYLHGTTSGYGQDIREWFTTNESVSWTAWCFSRQYAPVMWDDNWNLLGGEHYEGEFVKEFLADERTNELPSTSDSTPPTVPSNLSSPTHDSSSVDLEWDASNDAGGSGLDHYTVYVDGVKDHEVGAGSTATTVSGLSTGTIYTFSVTAVDSAGNESDASNTLPVTPGSNAFTITGGGWDGWDDSDSNSWSSFHWAYESVSGDTTLTARLIDLTTDNVDWDIEAAGIHIQGSTDGGDEAGAAIVVENGSSFEEMFWSKSATGIEGIRSGTTSTSLARWLTLERVDDTVTGYVSLDGSGWTKIGSATLNNLPTGAHIGIGVTSGDGGSSGTLQTAEFDNVSGLETWSDADLGGAKPAGSTTEV